MPVGSLLFRSPLISDASGQIDGMIAARNAGGLYFRSKIVAPDDPTTRRLYAREAMATVVARWKSELTQDDRDAWEAFAVANPSPGRLGNVCQKGGMDEYIHANALRRFYFNIFHWDVGFIDTPPASRGIDFTPLAIKVADGTTDTLNIAWNADDSWPDNIGGAFLWVGIDKLPPTRNFYARKYVPLIVVGGEEHPDNPQNVALPYDLIGGYRCFWRYRIFTADGRLSPEARGFAAPA